MGRRGERGEGRGERGEGRGEGKRRGRGGNIPNSTQKAALRLMKVDELKAKVRGHNQPIGKCKKDALIRIILAAEEAVEEKRAQGRELVEAEEGMESGEEPEPEEEMEPGEGAESGEETEIEPEEDMGNLLDE